MQEKELRKMGRKELLEMLLEQSKEVNYLKEQLKQTKEQLTLANRELEDRRIRLTNAGSIAEAALQINNVFNIAQKAADDYLEGVKNTAGMQDAEPVSRERRDREWSVIDRGSSEMSSRERRRLRRMERRKAAEEKEQREMREIREMMGFGEERMDEETQAAT